MGGRGGGSPSPSPEITFSVPFFPRSTNAKGKLPSPNFTPTSPSAKTAPNPASTVATAPRPAPSSAAASGEWAPPSATGGEYTTLGWLLAGGSGAAPHYLPPSPLSTSCVRGEEDLWLSSPLAPSMCRSRGDHDFQPLSALVNLLPAPQKGSVLVGDPLHGDITGVCGLYVPVPPPLLPTLLIFGVKGPAFGSWSQNQSRLP